MSGASFGELVRVFGRIGLLSFGGPAAQIAMMHRDLVDERGWLPEKEFLAALSFCMLLPGPEAMQLATYAGWKLRGVPGGLAAGLLFVLPGAALVLALSMAYAAFGALPAMQALFLGIQAAVVAVVIEALLRVGKRALKGPADWAIAGAAFLAIFALHIPFPLIIAMAALAGALIGRRPPPPEGPAPAASLSATARTALIWGAVWLLPLAALIAFEGGILAEIGLFFSKLAIVTFGGAYAVLAYMAQEAVQGYGWLTADEMIDGLGLAETTPGPLILVTQFVGYLAAFREGGAALGLAGAAVTLWMTFAPCFLWIFAGAPWTLWIAARPRLAAVLSGVTAAVVGVILNLSLWFAAHVFFGRVGEASLGPLRLIAPDPASFDWRAGAIAILATILLFALHRGIVGTLALAAAAGLALSLL
jgi:chromate transporter